MDTIISHFQDRGLDPDHYDAVVTGDLGKYGKEIAIELLKRRGFALDPVKLFDCGCMIYHDWQPVFAGGSGCGCIAGIGYGHWCSQVENGQMPKVLLVGTGALHSPLSIQQNESIPCVAHAVSLERI